jgi:hypothetical protein
MCKVDGLRVHQLDFVALKLASEPKAFLPMHWTVSMPLAVLS